MSDNKLRFAFDIGFSSIGYAVNRNYKKFKNNLPVWGGVWMFDNGETENQKTFSSVSMINQIKRDKKRKNRRKMRLKAIRELLKITMDENFSQELKRTWGIVEYSEVRKLTKNEFNALLYHFMKNRGYIDMTKKEKKSKNKDEEKEAVKIKGAIKALEQFGGGNVFQKLLAYRKSLIDTVVDNLHSKYRIDKKEAREFLDRYMPYRNRDITKLIKSMALRFNIFQDLLEKKEDEFKKAALKEAFDLFGKDMSYFFILPNEEIAKAIKDIARIQKEVFNNELISDKELEDYINILTDKGIIPCREEKIGYCDSGEKYKRSGKNTYDYEKFKIIDIYKKVKCTNKDGVKFNIYECMLFEEFEKRVLGYGKDEITAADMKKILKDLKVKEISHNQSSTLLYLKAHYLYKTLKNKRILEDGKFRDEVEYILLFCPDPKKREEELRKKYKDEFDEEDFEKLLYHDVGKPGFLSNKVCREILPQLLEKDLNEIMDEYRAKNIKFLNRDYLSFKEWKKDLQFSNYYLETITKNFIKLFNHLVQNFGTPDEIVIESARDFAISAKEKHKKDEQLRKAKESEEINKAIREYIQKTYKGVPDSTKSLMFKRIRLFYEQSNKKSFDINATAKCPLTGAPITFEDALNGAKTNIDHIIPRSVKPDNSLNNLILISAGVNQGLKSDMTATEYVATMQNKSLKEAAKIIKNHIKGTNIKGRKVENLLLCVKASEIKYSLKGFDEKHLQNTHFGVRVIKELLIRQYHFNNPDLSYHQRAAKIIFSNGKVTSLLRKWLLPNYKKDRKEHIHHLVDALILLLIDRSIQQKIHTIRNKYMQRELYKKQIPFISYLKEEFFKSKKDILEGKFNPEEPVAFFKEKFDSLELGVYREEVRKRIKRFFEQTIVSPKKITPANIKTPSGYRKKADGFKKLIIFKNNENKFDLKIVNYFEKFNDNDIQNKICELYRYSLVEFKMGIGYVIGVSRKEIEIRGINKEFSARKRPQVTTFIQKANITPLGVIKRKKIKNENS